MDKEFLDKLISIVISNQNENTYEGFDKLITTFTDEEIIYFFKGCGDDLFINTNLIALLLDKIPFIFASYVYTFIDDKINEANIKMAVLEKKFKSNLIDKTDYDVMMEAYKSIISSSTELKVIYITDILNNLNKK